MRCDGTAHDAPERGASSAEYALLVAAIAAVIVVVVYLLGTAVRGNFATTCQNIETERNAGVNCNP